MTVSRQRSVAVTILAVAGLLAALYTLVLIPSPHPNILFISIDTLRADHLRCYGAARPTSSNLDRFGAGGILFPAAYAPRGETSPSLASVLTGVYPSHHGVLTNRHELPEELTTLTGLLAKAGYDTAAFFANGVIEASKIVRDFRRWRCTDRSGVAQNLCDAAAVAAGIEYLSRERQEPFFLWIHLMDPHSPYQAGPGERGRFVKRTDDRGGLDGSRRQLAMITRKISPFQDFFKEDKDDICAMYDEEVLGSDRRVGEILAAVKRLGLEKTTIVCIFADHGEELADHNRYFFHSASVYRPVLHVPLMWRLPTEGPATARAQEPAPPMPRTPVSLVDIAPTIAAMLDLRFPHECDGIDLRPLFRGGSVTRDAVFTEHLDAMCGVITERYHCIHNPDLTRLVAGFTVSDEDLKAEPKLAQLAKPCAFTVAETELYDIIADPTEQKNLAAVTGETTTRLLARITTYASNRKPVNPVVITDEEILKGLDDAGYWSRKKKAQEKPPGQ